MVESSYVNVLTRSHFYTLLICILYVKKLCSAQAGKRPLYTRNIMIITKFDQFCVDFTNDVNRCFALSRTKNEISLSIFKYDVTDLEREIYLPGYLE